MSSTTHQPDRSDRVPLHERLLELWARPVPDAREAWTAFSSLYTDPVTINGATVPLSGLVDRATQLHAALERTGVRVLDLVEAPGKLVIAFEMTARHVGTWHSALGDVAATGRTVSVRTIDILTVEDGRINGIWVVSDEASLLAQLAGG
jgi:predicted ester cyclase